MKTNINIPLPDLQVEFSFALTEIRGLYLQDALRKTVQKMNIVEIDRELAAYVPKEFLAILAGRGLRGELVFPVPCVLEENPRLLGYYRLLLGYSQKAFYDNKETGLSAFKKMETRGIISDNVRNDLPDLCHALIEAGCTLVGSLSREEINPSFLDDLTLLTLGPQLRGGANVRRGTAGIHVVFNAIHDIVEHAIVTSNQWCIEIQNAAGRKVLIEFSSDPDISIREQMVSGTFRNIIAIEVKAGQDFSNVHNRLGEAEKSHQKAKTAGYVECWTVLNVDRIDLELARKESPTTNRFYLISSLLLHSGAEFDDFKSRIISLTGITEK